MTLREIILKTDFEEWAKRKSLELFGERPEYIKSLFSSIFDSLVRLAERGGRPAGAVYVSEDGLFAKFRVNDVPIEQLMNVECEEDGFDLVMWELARSGKNWK